MCVGRRGAEAEIERIAGLDDTEGHFRWRMAGVGRKTWGEGVTA